MKVLLDARKLGDGGIGTYLENLIDGALELRDELSLTLLVSTGSKAKARWPEISTVEYPAGKYSLKELFLFSWHYRKILLEHDLFHVPHYTLPFFIPIPTVVTIHDAIHVTHPDTVFHKIFGYLYIYSALKRANRVITVSEASKAVLQRIFPREIEVIPNALKKSVWKISKEQVQGFLKEKNLPTQYLLFVGSDRPHKGFKELCDALSILRLSNDSRTKDFALVVIGNRYSDRDALEREFGERIRFLGEVSEDDYIYILNGAVALIVTSKEEGFCLPALEALACEVPVISTPIPAVREVCGAGAVYAKGFSSGEIAENIREFFMINNRKFALPKTISFIEGVTKNLEIYRKIKAN